MVGKKSPIIWLMFAEFHPKRTNLAIENADMLKFIVSNKCIRQVNAKRKKERKKKKEKKKRNKIVSNHSINFVRFVFDVKIALIFSKSSGACISFDIVLV